MAERMVRDGQMGALILSSGDMKSPEQAACEMVGTLLLVTRYGLTTGLSRLGEAEVDVSPLFDSSIPFLADHSRESRRMSCPNL